MKSKTKKEMIRELNAFLMIENIAWERLPKKDLERLHEAFLALRNDVADVFNLIGEWPYSIEPAREDDLTVKTEKPSYCI